MIRHVVLPSTGSRAAEGRQRLSLSLSVIFCLFSPCFIVHFVRLKLLRGKNEELLSFWSMGGPKKGPKIPEILFEIRTKKNLEQNLPFGGIRIRIKPLSSFLHF
jgi:hypothetical protein